MKIIELDCTDSTNEYLKRENLPFDVAVVAARQTGGRGTKGRSFISEEGGLYISVQKIYRDMPASRAFEIMTDACTAVCRTLESFGFSPVIRWPNDVLVNGRKICGTLIENTLSSGYILRSIVGIGLNVNNVLPADLQPFATTMSAEGGRIYGVSDVRGALLDNLELRCSIADYKRYIDWLGSTVALLRGDTQEEVTAVDISADGRLVCRSGGATFSVSSAEVSLRIKGG